MEGLINNNDLLGIFELKTMDFQCLASSTGDYGKLSTNLVKLSYINGMYTIRTYGYLLKYPQTTIENNKTVEIVYLRIDIDELCLYDYIIKRVECVLTASEDGSFWIMDEKILSLSEKSIIKIIANFDVLSQGKYSLTHLRNIVVNKNR